MTDHIHTPTGDPRTSPWSWSLAKHHTRRETQQAWNSDPARVLRFRLARLLVSERCYVAGVSVWRESRNTYELRSLTRIERVVGKRREMAIERALDMALDMIEELEAAS